MANYQEPIINNNIIIMYNNIIIITNIKNK